ncbi:DUF3301 domain-containing protein [Tahibacter amnicola]|uniref:DUF3301 domain-containing protein n=1 Tax=Tahibacter amnicola TaxID=2976241 RepID=A0ABY6BHK9_9GAMM|nr:DUF3301 domain-containing protein [Tahibacter amnicola]UXI69499.1 DUF3301 domain-containing protein [Tahibacter amnicola]
MLSTLFVFLLVSFAALVWQDAVRARDRATAITRTLCERAGLQFLDQSVSLKRMSLVRQSSGRLGLRRQYGFDVSTDGSDRHRGSLRINGDRLEDFTLPVRPSEPAVWSSPTLH